MSVHLWIVAVVSATGGLIVVVLLAMATGGESILTPGFTLFLFLASIASSYIYETATQMFKKRKKKAENV